jgi:ribosomal protein L37E
MPEGNDSHQWCLDLPEPCRICGRATYNPELKCDVCEPGWQERARPASETQKTAGIQEKKPGSIRNEDANS